MRALARRLLLLILLLPACRCGEPGGQRAYDVGVPLEDLPAASGDLVSAVPGPVLAYAEVADGHALALAVGDSAWFRALQKSGGLSALALSGPAATLTALSQRLNDLSRSPIGEEALADLLDGPLAMAARPHGRDGFDLLLVKAVPAAGQGALRLARMLEAVHPSASEVGVERHQGLPVRALRLDGSRKLYYVVLRDRLLVATDPGWLQEALDLSLDRALPRVQPSLRALKKASAHARGFALIDGRAATDSGSLGLFGRALSGLAWIGLRWNENGVELGARRRTGTFGARGPPLATPPGTALVLAREASLDELLAVPPAPDGGATDGGDDVQGGALLGEVKAVLSPAFGGHVAYALASDAEHNPEHLLALATRGPGASAAVDALAPKLFRAPTGSRHDEVAPGGHCVGAPPALCWAQAGAVLELATGPGMLRAGLEAQRSSHPLAWGPMTLYFDAPLVAQLLGREANLRHRGASAELEPLVAALRASRPALAQLEPAPDPAEAWGLISEVPRGPEPKREARDGGAP